jgi:hypothetical protein
MAANLDGLVDELRDAARALDTAVWQSGLSGRFTSTRRSSSEQTRLYRAYLAGRSRFPVAAPGFSAHEYGEAFDYVVSPFEYQSNVGQTWVSWGGEWGGAADVVHFELPGASSRAIARGKALESEAPWYVDLAAGLPFGLATSVLFDYFGIPAAARKDVTPEQLEYLKTLVPRS